MKTLIQQHSPKNSHFLKKEVMPARKRSLRLTLSHLRDFMQPKNARQARSSTSSSRWKNELLMERMTLFQLPGLEQLQENSHHQGSYTQILSQEVTTVTVSTLTLTTQTQKNTLQTKAMRVPMKKRNIC